MGFSMNGDPEPRDSEPAGTNGDPEPRDSEPAGTNGDAGNQDASPEPEGKGAVEETSPGDSSEPREEKDLVLVPGAPQDCANISEEELREALRQGKPIENRHILSLCFESDIDYREAVVIKDSVVERIDLRGNFTLSKLHLENVCFPNRLEIGEDSLARDGSATLVWKSCVFEDGAVVESLRTRHVLCFIGCEFRKELLIRDCAFEEEANLSENRCRGGFRIEKCRFAKRAKIQRNRFNAPLSFSDVVFEEGASGAGSDFQKVEWSKIRFLRGSVDFSESRFRGPFNLQDVSSQVSVKFGNCEFAEPVKAQDCAFQDWLAWGGTRFQKKVDFSSNRFEAGVSFMGTSFGDKASFDKAFLKDAHFQGSQFLGEVSLQKVHTQGEFLWQGVRCAGKVSFDFSEFKGRASFSNMTFEAPVSFYRTVFKDPAWFLSTRFQDVSFVNTTFEGPAFFSFDRNTLNERNRRRKQGPREKTLDFVCVFNGAANFINALFYRTTVFENVFFRKFANFDNACFAEEINFENSHFQQGASFKGSFCSQELNFSRTVFDDYVNFDLANINRRLNLTDATINRGISFYHAVIDVVVVERDQIEGRLLYEGSVPGCAEKRHLMRVKEEYLILKESLNQRGKFDEEDWAYYKYRVNDRKSLTEKAWRSLSAKPILAVQDDIPREEEEEEKSLLLQADKNLAQAEKKVDSHRKRIERLGQDHAKSKNPKLLKEIEQIQGKMEKENQRLLELRRISRDTSQLLEMNQERKRKCVQSKEKPFGTFGASVRLFKSALWQIVDWGTGYGVKPFRIAFLAAAVILFFACVYYAYGVPYPSHTPATPEIQKFLDWTHFSAMAFATSSPEGESLAYNDKIKFFIMAEALVGLFLMALFVGCYTRKIIR